VRSRLQSLSVLSVLSSLILAQPVRAQGFTVTAADGIVIVLGDGRLAVLRTDRNGVVVSGIVPGEKPTAATVDVQVGDRVVGIQQETNPPLDRISATYEGLSAGAEVLLTLQRGSAAPHQVRFPRPATVPAGARQAVMSGDKPGAAGAWVSAGAPSGVTEMVIAGTHIRSNDQGMPQVMLRASHPAVASVPLRTGDVITAVNGKSIAALAGLEKFYQPIEPGGAVALTVTREGREIQVAFRKPAP